MTQILFYISVNDETTMATHINSGESAVDCNGDSKYECNGLATDENTGDSNIQSLYTSFATTIKNSSINCDSTEMR